MKEITECIVGGYFSNDMRREQCNFGGKTL